MRKVTANSKASKHLIVGKEYEVTEEIALILEGKGWVGDEPAQTPKPKTRTRKAK